MRGPEALPGGEGKRFRAHCSDSESGGAKSHYPNCRTSLKHRGSRRRENIFILSCAAWNSSPLREHRQFDAVAAELALKG